MTLLQPGLFDSPPPPTEAAASDPTLTTLAAFMRFGLAFLARPTYAGGAPNARISRRALIWENNGESGIRINRMPGEGYAGFTRGRP